MLVVKGSNFDHGDQFLFIFQILMLYWQTPKKEINGKTDSYTELVHI